MVVAVPLKRAAQCRVARSDAAQAEVFKELPDPSDYNPQLPTIKASVVPLGIEGALQDGQTTFLGRDLCGPLQTPYAPMVLH